MYRLHCIAQSGNAFKVAFFLRALQQPFETVEVGLFDGEARDPAWRQRMNEMGELPVLEDGDRRLTQSGAVLVHLARKHGAYGGRTPEEEAEVLRWLLFDNHKFTSYFASYRFAKSFAPVAPDPAVMAWLKGRIDNAFAIADKHFASTPFAAGPQPTVADFSMSGYVFYPVEESGYDLDARFPNLAAWRDRMRQVPGWADPYDVLPGPRLAPKW
jgi:glutathione S-transferase